MTDLNKLIKPGTSTQDNRTSEDTEGEDGGDAAPPTMLEVLGEHLYRKVEEVQGGSGIDLDVARVTGMLLELGEQQVLRLLQDRQMLQQSVKKVIQHVPDVCLHASSSSSSDAGSSLKEEDDSESGQLDEERLYEQVCQLEPELSPHITGMLLELGRSRVKSLLRSPASLRRAVTHAKTAYSQHSGSSSPASPSSVDVKPVDESPTFRVKSSVDEQHTTAVNNSKQSCLAEKVTQSIARSMVSQDGQKHDGVGLRTGMAGQRVDKCDWVLGDDDDDVTEEEVGDVVYTEAERLYPQSAAKLTGMILDMGADQVRQYLHDKDLLHRAIHLAFTSLSGINSQC